jgi:tRNA-specific 2-thiouridylase
VIQTDAASQRVTVGRNEQLLRTSLRVRDANWIAWETPPEEFRAEVKIRNKHAAAAATVHNGREVLFDMPQRAVTPGQAAVFYQGDLVLGGGWIV